MKVFATPTRKRSGARSPAHHGRLLVAPRRAARAVQRAEVRHILRGPRLQPELAVGTPVQQGSPGRASLLQRNGDDDLSLERLWELAGSAYEAGREVVEEAESVPGRAAAWATRQYRRAQPVAERAFEAVEQGVLFGARGDETTRALRFDGSQLTVEGNPSLAMPAVSGLQPHAPGARGIDYTDPIYQDQRDRGPIPEGEYYVVPSEVQTSLRHGFNPSAWGRYRVLLHPTAATYRRRVVLGRGGGFYLHEDANRNGTAGCIGLLSAADNRVVYDRIRHASRSIPVTVVYSENRRTRPSGEPSDCPDCEPSEARRQLTHPDASTSTNYTEVGGAWEAARAALDPNGGEIRVAGEGLRRVRDNRGTRHAWHDLMRQILGYRFRNPRGRRVAYFRPRRAIAYGGNYFDPGDYFTTGTWLIGHCYPTAQFELSYCREGDERGLRGIVHAIWVIHDDLDLEPGRGRGPIYNRAAEVLSLGWHDLLGGRRTAPVYVEWEETRAFCLSASGVLHFDEVPE